MPLKIEIIADRNRGPGYGLLRLEGLNTTGDSVTLTVQENQRGDFLTAEGRWQGQNASLTLPLIQGSDGAAMAPLGPQLVDCLATLPPSCRLQATIGNQRGVILLSQELRPSTAKAAIQPDPAPAAAPEPAPTPPPVPEPAVPLHAENRTVLSVEDDQRPPQKGKGVNVLWLSLLAALAVLCFLAAAGFWYISQRAKEVLPLQPAVENPAVPSTTAPINITTREELNQYLLTTPSADDVKGVGDTLSAAGKSDLAMLAWQYAARNGNLAAYGAMASLYDPDTWSSKTSPIPQADAETAAYWYEPAAMGGDVVAMRQLGKILTTLYPDGRQHEKGLDWLTKAAGNGDDEAKRLLEKKTP